jgi:putative hydrolase
VSDEPFGFGPPPGEDDDSGREKGRDRSGEPEPAGGEPERTGGVPDPFAALFGGATGLPFGGQLDPAAIGAAFHRLGELMAWQGGPVNWDLARDVARQAVAGSGGPAGAEADRSPGAPERAAVTDAVRLAELWLDDATSLPAGTTGAVAWSRAEWVEGTLPAWREVVDPVASKVVDAMGAAMTGNVPEEMRAQVQAMAGPLQQMMRSMGGAMFGAQVGQALGTLAGEVVSSTDVGLPMAPTGGAVLVPANVTAFGSGLGVPEDQVRLYLALREAAHHRLYGHVPWLRGRAMAALEDYARGISVDTERIQEQLSGLDPGNPQALHEALSSGLLAPRNTPEQDVALRRLETLLALVEGWVDEVVDAAAAPRLPSAGALRETVRRRRAAGGPAEQTFAALVGLELRPRRLRDAAALWHRLTEAHGVEGRDAVWAHPDLLPSAEDLDDPESFVSRAGPLDLSGLDELAPPPEERDRPEPGDA